MARQQIRKVEQRRTGETTINMTVNQKRKWDGESQKKGKRKKEEESTKRTNRENISQQTKGEEIRISEKIYRKTVKKRKEATGSGRIKIANLNVRGLKNKCKQQMLLDIFAKEDLDILAVAETN